MVVANNTPADIEAVLARLTGVRRRSDGWDADCPVAGHGTPPGHLSLKDAGEKALVFCHGLQGHSYEDICQALGFDSLRYNLQTEKKPFPKLTDEEAMALLQQSYGLTETTLDHFKIKPDWERQAWRYPVEDGHRFKRYSRRGPRKYWHTDGTPNQLYGVEDIPPATEEVWLVNGEPAKWVCWQAGVPACCGIFGEGKLPDNAKAELKTRGIKVVNVPPDLDHAGKQAALAVYEDLKGEIRVRIRLLPEYLGDKGDVADLFNRCACDRDAFRKALNELAETTPDVVERKRLTIVITDRRIRDMAAEAWAALTTANHPPSVFQRGRLPVDIVLDHKQRPSLRTLDKAAFRGVLDRAADFVRLDRDGNEHPARPPKDVVEDMLAAKDLPLPVLEGITEGPVLAANLELITAPGYQPGTGLYLHLAKGFRITDLSEKPTGEEVSRARNLLLEDLLGDFPFVDSADQAHAIGAIILPFVRKLIEGPTPLHMAESSTPGSGKGLLVDVLAIPAAGKGPTIMTEGRDEDEWRKRITARLLPGPQYVLIDNVRSRLDSAALSAAITCEVWEDRFLGHSRTAAIPVTCVWLATANNPTLSLEVARRTVSMRLDPQMERPWNRTGFKHSNLRRWARDHRGELTWAALTIVKKWVAEGRPSGTVTFGGFESWAEVTGGLLSSAGISGFLANCDRVYAEADQEVVAWTELCAAWWGEFQDRQVGADLLFGLCARRKLLLGIWGGRVDHSGVTRFGMALSKMRDRIIGNFRICQLGPDPHSGAQQYCLELLAHGGGCGALRRLFGSHRRKRKFQS